MTLTNRQSGTNVYEIADGVYRINQSGKSPGSAGGLRQFDISGIR